MRIIFISDTHGQHHLLNELPDGDIIIHAGDVSRVGKTDETEEFIEWYSSLKYRYKVFIAGNHDFYFEGKMLSMIQKFLPSNTYYLSDSYIDIEGLKIYGSPITPYFNNWAFNRQRGIEISKHWNMIPNDVDILVTHGAPYKILDKTVRGDYTGCEDLLSAVKRVCPKYHLFGHIHEEYGTCKVDDTTFINGSLLNENYSLVNTPVIFDL